MMLSRRQIEYGEELKRRSERELAEARERVLGLEEQLSAARAEVELLEERADLLDTALMPVVEEAARQRGMDTGEAEK